MLRFVRRSSALVVALTLGFGLPALAANTNAAAQVKDAKEKAKGKQAIVISPEREAAVLTFVRRNHPELELLLEHLREARPREYDKAVRELFRVTERLNQIQDRDTELYDLELRLWKIQSRLQLLSAKVQMGPQEESKQEIKAALKEQFQVKTAMLERQKQRLKEQTRKVDQELLRIKTEEEAWLAKQYELLTRPTSTESPGETATEVPQPEAKPASKVEAPAKPAATKKPDSKNKSAK